MVLHMIYSYIVLGVLCKTNKVSALHGKLSMADFA